MSVLRTLATNNVRELATAENFYAVTPADGTDLPNGQCRQLYVGTGGTVAAVNKDGDTVSFTAGDGGYLNIRTARVLATGTTATGIIALY